MRKISMNAEAVVRADRARDAKCPFTWWWYYAR